MAILKDPLFSEEARGQVAKVAVFKRAEVHPVFCAYSYHKVNWTHAKISHATAWKVLCNAWRSLSDEDQESWRFYAPGVLTGFNYFMQCKGVFPFEFCYVPPLGNLILFNFTIFPYAPPEGDSLTFDREPCL